MGGISQAEVEVYKWVGKCLKLVYKREPNRGGGRDTNLKKEKKKKNYFTNSISFLMGTKR